MVTYGLTLTEHGREDVASRSATPSSRRRSSSRSGAEIIRLWVATVDYTEDQRIGKAILQTVTDAYRKLRNTLRYLLGALDGFDDAERVGLRGHAAAGALRPAPAVGAGWRGARRLRRLRFNDVLRPVTDFCNIELSALYFDIRKDSLYCDRPTALRRRAAAR